MIGKVNAAATNGIGADSIGYEPKLGPRLSPQQFMNDVQYLNERRHVESWSVEYFADELHSLISQNQKTAKQLAFPTEYGDILNHAVNGQFDANILYNGSIRQRHFQKIAHGPLQQMNALVLHQTGGATAKSALNWYEHSGNAGYGAHYLIDTDGTVYQTLPVDQKAWHIGTIVPKCAADGSCTPETNQKIAAHSWSQLHAQEKNKPYPERHPLNEDSLGIEVVGAFDPQTNSYGPPTEAQLESLKKLVEALKTRFNLSDADIYVHSKISGHKQPSEARFMGY